MQLGTISEINMYCYSGPPLQKWSTFIFMHLLHFENKFNSNILYVIFSQDFHVNNFWSSFLYNLILLNLTMSDNNVLND